MSEVRGNVPFDSEQELRELGVKVFNWTTCPECGAFAEVTDRTAVKSSDGPVEFMRMTCVLGHHIFADVEVIQREQGRVLGDASEAGAL